MTSYLIRRFIQMAIVVLLATMAIYGLLNLAPGGPMAGLNQIGDRRQRYSAADKARLEAYLGLDKPLVLRYLVWLIGEDWLGADYMHVGLKLAEDETRFYASPGIAYASGGYPLWIEGPSIGTGAEGLEVIQAEKIWIRPEGETPEDVEVIQAAIIEVDGGTIKADVTGVIADIWVETSQATEWEYANAPKWPEGTWVNVSWLFGPYGVLGKYAHFHGTDRGVLRFDFGKSWSVARGKPISKIMQNRLKNTLTLTIAATVLSLVVSISVGIYSAVKQYSRLDYIVTTFTFFGTAMPVFWQGLMQMTVWSRYTRASMLEVLRQDYVRTARVKGLAERLVIVKHAMRNALIPIVTIVVFTIPGVFRGATITETIFSWQGMGRLYYDALGADD